MQLSYSALKNKNVINVVDGNNLGRVVDISFSFPEGKVYFLVVGEKKFFSGKEKIEIGLCCVKKIGEDAILVSLQNEFDDDYEDDCEEK